MYVNMNDDWNNRQKLWYRSCLVTPLYVFIQYLNVPVLALQLKVFHTQILELQQDVEARKAENEKLQKSEISETKTLSLELEKERGRLAGL